MNKSAAILLATICLLPVSAGAQALPAGDKPAIISGCILDAVHVEQGKEGAGVYLQVFGARAVKVRVHSGRSYGEWMSLTYGPAPSYPILNWHPEHLLPLRDERTTIEYAIGNNNGWKTGKVATFVKGVGFQYADTAYNESGNAYKISISSCGQPYPAGGTLPSNTANGAGNAAKGVAQGVQGINK